MISSKFIDVSGLMNAVVNQKEFSKVCDGFIGSIFSNKNTDKPMWEIRKKDAPITKLMKMIGTIIISIIIEKLFREMMSGNPTKQINDSKTTTPLVLDKDPSKVIHYEKPFSDRAPKQYDN